MNEHLITDFLNGITAFAAFFFAVPAYFESRRNRKMLLRLDTILAANLHGIRSNLIKADANFAVIYQVLGDAVKEEMHDKIQ